MQLIGSKSSGENRSYEPKPQTFTPANESYQADDVTEDDYSDTPPLDISSDDLPFYW